MCYVVNFGNISLNVNVYVDGQLTVKTTLPAKLLFVAISMQATYLKR